MTSQPINESLLSFIHKQTGRGVAYEQEPIPLLGGIDATTYKFKLRGMEPMVIRLLGSDRSAEEVKRLQIHSQALIHSNIKAPKVYWVGEDESLLGGVFSIMKFFPDPLLAEQPGDIQLKTLGKSHAEMHNKHLNVKDYQPLKRARVERKGFYGLSIHTYYSRHSTDKSSLAKKCTQLATKQSTNHLHPCIHQSRRLSSQKRYVCLRAHNRNH